MLEDVIKNDKAKGGLFSVPVPRDLFPEYYDVVKQPMDFGTMKSKLTNGEYRSAQAMQKDFLLIMQNCKQFNSVESDIVKEARRQALSMPALLRNAALKNKLFLAEDGTVIEIYSDDEKEPGDENDGGKKAKKSVQKQKKKFDKRKKKNSEGSSGKRSVAAHGVSWSKRLVRCKDCEGCNREDCGKCIACLDKPKFGGKGTLKQGCHRRQCENMKDSSNFSSITLSSPKHKSKSRSHDLGTENEDSMKVSEDSTEISSGTDSDETASLSSSSAKKPRIRIKLSMNGKKGRNQDISPLINDKKKTRKRSMDQDNPTIRSGKILPSIPRKAKKHKTKASNEDNVSINDFDSSFSIPKLKKKKKSKLPTDETTKNPDESIKKNQASSHLSKIPKKNEGLMSDTATDATSDSDTDSDTDSKSVSPSNDEKGVRRKTSQSCSDFIDNSSSLRKEYETMKSERLALNESFESSRNHFTKRGPWKLHEDISEDKYYDVAIHILNKMCSNDMYNLFAEKVSDDEAPGYSLVVSNSMDFGTMRSKLENGDYGSRSGALSALYSDFLLVMDNCALYNDGDSDVSREAARLMSFLPETFSAAVSAALSHKIKSRKKKKT